MKEKFTSSKTYKNLPCAHRQWKHEGHCAYIHGYSREYTFYFEAKEMDEHGWVVGFGDLKKLEKYLLDMYDHTMIICLLYTSPSPRDRQKSRMPSSA